MIVESPAKTRTLKNILRDRFDIVASMGHVRDLPKKKFGVDVEQGFEPAYEAIPERADTIRSLKREVKGRSDVYLALDPDREGEAIAWHISQALGLKNPKRVQFNAITRSAVEEALQSPGEIDENRVNAQQARRILDRIVGYKLSPLLWKKVRRNLSAGRVQSVAVRLIVEREREIQAHVPEEYWIIRAELARPDDPQCFTAVLQTREGKKYAPSTKDEAEQVLADLRRGEYIVSKVVRKRQERKPPAPFITSTLQQEAARRFKFSVKRTMALAQRLYEGIEIPGEGEVGLITYMRTDSTRVSSEATREAREFVVGKYGEDYVPDKPPVHRLRKGAQDAHEAIRPASVVRTPDQMGRSLGRDEMRLYKLIWERFLASQMAPAVYDVLTVDVTCSGRYMLRASSERPIFAGYRVLYAEAADEGAAEEPTDGIPELNEGDPLRLMGLDSEQKFTQPPPRYTEATLVRALEEKGIGRPSTYAAIITTIVDRRYVELVERRFQPTDLGFAVTDLLVTHFGQYVDVEFTARVEADLDVIEDGRRDWREVLSAFYGPFMDVLERTEKTAERVRIAPKESDQTCPNCGRKMVIREGRYGRFLGCSGFPDCRTILPMVKRTGVKCPRQGCGGELIEKMSRKSRKVFYGCERYPDCDFALWNKPVPKPCPVCGYILTEKRRRDGSVQWACAANDCPHTEEPPTEESSEEEENSQPEAAAGAC
jgi:DNA topoisomerase-1